jgi:hypothetical protein
VAGYALWSIRARIRSTLDLELYLVIPPSAERIELLPGGIKRNT